MTTTNVLDVTCKLSKPIITEGRIDKRAEKLANRIVRDYKNEKPVLICIERGGRKWTSKVLSYLRNHVFDFEVGSVSAKSYILDKSSGSVKIDNYVGPDLQGRHVVFLEDILDTLKTITTIDEWAKDLGAVSVAVCAMLFKRRSDNILWQLKALFGHRLVRYIGFYIANLFVIGAGLDYNERCRELSPDGVYVMTSQAKAWLDSLG